MINNRRRTLAGLAIVWLALGLVACSPRATPLPIQSTTQAPIPATNPPPAVETIQPPTSAPGSSPVSTQASREPLEVEFKAEDGQVLHGRYYPASVNPAALVVLMHWAPGDQNDWSAVASWLSGSGSVTTQDSGTGVGKPWLDPSWFPAMPEGQSLAVFTFTFRRCEGGCKSFYRAAWLMDARAAMVKARELEGVEPNRIVAIGASIGSDGAVDGCDWLNQQFPNSCLGALSLSPGGYLTVRYQDAVSDLSAEQPPKPAWCLYAQGDGESKKACKDASGENYKSVEYTGSNHGMELIQPEVEPSALQLILDFLKLTVGSQ